MGQLLSAAWEKENQPGRRGPAREACQVQCEGRHPRGHPPHSLRGVSTSAGLGGPPPRSDRSGPRLAAGLTGRGECRGPGLIGHLRCQ